MAQPSIIFQEGQGGLGRPLPNNDHISGMLFYTNTLPSGYSSNSRVKTLYSADDAIALGILKDYSDATAATGTYLITTAGATGDTSEIKIADRNPLTGAPRSTSLGVYTKTAADSSIALLGASITAMINAGTQTHGYSATFNTATITITAPKAQGSFLNSGTPISVTIVGTTAGTITQFSGGVSSALAIYNYHISEFFRMQPKGILHVGFYAVPGTYTFSEVKTMKDATNAAMRQIAVWKDAVYATADITALQTIANTCKSEYGPLVVLYAGNLQATTDITTLTDLNLLSNPLVSNIIAQDGGGLGNFLYQTNLKSISSIGNALGVVAARKVSESIAWVEVGNLSNGSEMEVLAFSNGQLYTALSVSALDALHAKRHIFAKKFPNYSGSFYSDSQSAVLSTSDYAYIENNRTIQKAERNLYSAFLPQLNSPIRFNADGTITDIDIARLENIGNVSLDQMIKDQEISAKSVTIDPTQDVLTTSTITIAVVLVINGVARNIVIPISFKPSIA
jgi:hypothetical protein